MSNANAAFNPPPLAQTLSRLRSHGPLLSILGPDAIAATMARVDPRTERATAAKEGGVALVNVRGVIVPREDKYSTYFGEVGAEDTAARIVAAIADPKVKAVVVAFDTPGGNVSGVPESTAVIRAAVAASDKPVVGQVDFMCASAGVWLGSGLDEMCAAPSAGYGNVGVISMHVDQTKMLAEMGVTVTPYAMPADKADGWGYWANSDKFDARMQQMIAETYAQFVADIVASRPRLDRATILAEWAGYYNAPRALLLGMIDKVRSISDTFAAYTANTGTTKSARNKLALLSLKGRPAQ